MSQIVAFSTFTVDTVTEEIITPSAHNLYANSLVQFTSTISLPTGIASSTTYYAIVTSGTRFQIALTSGGAAENISSSGSGTMTVHHEVLATGKSLQTFESPDSIQSLPWFGGLGNDSALRGQYTLGSPDSIQSLVWFNDDASQSLFTFAASPDAIQSEPWFNLFARQQLLTFGATDALLEAQVDSGASIAASMTLEFVLMPCNVETPLILGVDYQIDPVNGRIMFLSTGALGGGALEDGNVCGVTVTACCQEEGCLYGSDVYACDRACYVFDGYDTVMQEGSEPYRSGDEKMIKRVMVEAEPLPQSTPSPIECDVAYGNQPSCMTWVSTRPLEFECQSEMTRAQHITAKTRPDGVFSFPTWRRGQYISTRFRIRGIGGGGTFSALHKALLGWGQADSP